MRNSRFLLYALVAVSLLGPHAAWAAAIRIDDASSTETITVSANDFECGGFSVNGALIQEGVGSPGSITVPESAGAVSFHGQWVDLGQSTQGTRTIYLVEYCGSGNKLHKRISDILQFTVTTDGTCGTIDGTFTSDSNPTGPGLGEVPPGVDPNDVFLENDTPVNFGAAFLSGLVVSDRSKQGNCR